MTGARTDRRSLLKAGLAAPIALQAAPAAGAGDSGPFAPERLFADVKAYADTGNKQSGGAGDRWTADWTARRLSGAGFAVERQPFDVPWFEAATCALTLGDRPIPLVAQPLAVPTGTSVGSDPNTVVFKQKANDTFESVQAWLRDLAHQNSARSVTPPPKKSG